MIRIAKPQKLELIAEEINSLKTEAERKSYVLEKMSFFIDDTRLRNLELRIHFQNTFNRPDGLMIFYFQQLSSSQLDPFDLTFHAENPVIIRPNEEDFWKNHPFYVDRIGILANRIKSNCSLTIETFKIM